MNNKLTESQKSSICALKDKLTELSNTFSDIQDAINNVEFLYHIAEDRVRAICSMKDDVERSLKYSKVENISFEDAFNFISDIPGTVQKYSGICGYFNMKEHIADLVSDSINHLDYGIDECNSEEDSGSEE